MLSMRFVVECAGSTALWLAARCAALHPHTREPFASDRRKAKAASSRRTPHGLRRSRPFSRGAACEKACCLRRQKPRQKNKKLLRAVRISCCPDNGLWTGSPYSVAVQFRCCCRKPKKRGNGIGRQRNQKAELGCGRSPPCRLGIWDSNLLIPETPCVFRRGQLTCARGRWRGWAAYARGRAPLSPRHSPRPGRARTYGRPFHETRARLRPTRTTDLGAQARRGNPGSHRSPGPGLPRLG